MLRIAAAVALCVAALPVLGEAEWYEAHVVLGAAEAGTIWAIASAATGGPDVEETFVLIANEAAAAGRVRVTLVFDDGSRSEQVVPIIATSRATLMLSALFPESRDRRFSVLVESLGGTPVPIVVETARYGSPTGELWGAGAAMLATRVR